MIVEVDGMHHREQAEADTERTLFLVEAGFQAIRVENDEVLRSIESVCKRILKVVPLPSGDGGGAAGEAKHENSDVH